MLRKPKPMRKARTTIRKKSCVPISQVNFANGMRKLWVDHAIWTMTAINSLIDGSEATEAVVARLLKNQDDIGNYIKPYYGEVAGKQLATLLRAHITIAAQLVTAAKAGDQEEVDKYNRLWYRNADEIVDFLSKANPKYSAQELQSKFYLHLQQVFNIASARINHDWEAEIKAFDAGLNHIMHIADYLSEGIIKQFPTKFK